MNLMSGLVDRALRRFRNHALWDVDGSSIWDWIHCAADWVVSLDVGKLSISALVAPKVALFRKRAILSFSLISCSKLIK